MNIQEQLLQTWQDLLASAVAWTPRIGLAVVLLVVALVVAKLVERMLRGILTRIHFDSLVAKVGIDQALQRIGLRQSINVFIPRLVYFLLLVLFARTGADALGLEAISSAIASFMAYLPNIVAALLILVLGSAASQVAGRTVAEAAGNSGIDFAPALGNLVSGVLFFVLGIMAISQLRIDTEIVRLFASAVLAAGALAFGLSFGLGSRDVTRNILAGFYARKTLAIGQTIEVAGERGVLVAVTPTQIVLDQDGETITVANTVLLEQVVRQ